LITGSFSRSNRISPICFGELRLNGWPAPRAPALELEHLLAQLSDSAREQRRVDQHAVRAPSSAAPATGISMSR
jgi:hypothetical protein